MQQSHDLLYISGSLGLCCIWIEYRHVPSRRQNFWEQWIRLIWKPRKWPRAPSVPGGSARLLEIRGKSRLLGIVLRLGCSHYFLSYFRDDITLQARESGKTQGQETSFCHCSVHVFSSVPPFDIEHLVRFERPPGNLTLTVKISPGGGNFILRRNLSPECQQKSRHHNRPKFSYT